MPFQIDFLYIRKKKAQEQKELTDKVIKAVEEEKKEPQIILPPPNAMTEAEKKFEEVQRKRVRTTKTHHTTHTHHTHYILHVHTLLQVDSPTTHGLSRTTPRIRTHTYPSCYC